MSPRRPPCMCLTHDDLCASCAQYGKALANHQRELGRKPRQGDTGPQHRRNVTPGPLETSAVRFARARGITVAEAERFLARQAAARAERQWWQQWERRP